MTAVQKLSLARFLDTAACSLRDGYQEPERDYQFTDDEAPPSGGEERPLPLAYLVDEEDDAENEDGLGQIAAASAACSACGLCQTRTRAVPGEGVERPLVLVVGEGPGADEDASGRPFVGKAGQLLDRMLASVGLSRERNAFIANVVKCRPPGNRDPAPEEIAACAPFLERQIRILKPKMILCAGRTAARYILHTEEGINRLRGKFGEYPAAVEITETETLQSSHFPPVPVLPGYHPSALLRDDSLRRPAFEDLKLLMAKLIFLDSGYAAEVKPLLNKYAAADADFAARVRDYPG
jgi:DNA polymerase